MSQEEYLPSCFILALAVSSTFNASKDSFLLFLLVFAR